MTEQQRTEHGNPLAPYGMEEAGGCVFTTGDTRSLVCNFIPVRIREGEARYMDESSTPVHLVNVKTGRGEFRWKLYGDLFSESSWSAASGGRTVVAMLSRFKTYLNYKIAEQGIVDETQEVDEAFVVGTARDGDGQLQAYDEVEFPGGRQQCLYHGWSMPQGGDKEVFDKAANLTTDATVRTMLVHVLGSVFKPVLGPAYPHVSLQGDKQVGKTTVVREICRLFGLRQTTAPVEFSTQYRRKKTLANTTWPVFADELGRLRGKPFNGLCDLLNDSYNAKPSTHGSGGQVLVIMAPLVILGQDCPIRDEALLSKTLIYEFAAGTKNSPALKQVRGLRTQFPLAEWVNFACCCANQRNLQSEADKEAEKLAEKVDADCRSAETDRTIWNYATQLVAARALREFGVAASIEEYVQKAAQRHLRLMKQEGRDLAERFVVDVAELLATPPARAGTIYDVEKNGLYLHVGSALRCLRRMGRRYDISDPRALTRRLGEKKWAEANRRHYFNGSRLRCVFLSRETFRRFGCDISTDDYLVSNGDGENCGDG